MAGLCTPWFQLNLPVDRRLSPLTLSMTQPVWQLIQLSCISQSDIDGESVVHQSDCSPASFGNTIVNIFEVSGDERYSMEYGGLADDSTATQEWPWWYNGECMSYDPTSNRILMCSLRSHSSFSPSSPYVRGLGSSGRYSTAEEFYESLWKNCGHAPCTVAGGRYEWKDALDTLAQVESSIEDNHVVT